MERSSVFAYPIIHHVGYLENKFKSGGGWNISV
ncbi:hypothetical protein BAPA111454_19245 [Bacillus paranthracis]|nr:hypothetical protein BACERE00195_01363 [Bacillus cereus]